MSFYLLPPIQSMNDMLNHVIPTYSYGTKTNDCDIVISKTLCRYLNIIKTEIDKCPMEWDKYKKHTNPYEYIHTTVPNTKQSVCTLNPLSRSFFKMVEITHLLNLLVELPAIGFKSFHLAEGPGGFIEALVSMRNNPSDLYYGMTLVDDVDGNVPGWRKSKYFLEKNANVIIEFGKDGRGDLMNSENLRHCFHLYNSSIDFITADGGFDFSLDFNKQEQISIRLIFCQVAFAIAMQKKSGRFVIKFFDTFTKISLDLLFLLANVYDQVYFVKPNTSRYANSEKYIVCKGFRKMVYKEELIKQFFQIFQTLSATPDTTITSLFDFELPYYFTSRIEEYNSIFGNQQMEIINNTLAIVANNKYDRLDTLKNMNIQKCIQWCQLYNLPYNKLSIPNNIFLANKGV